MTEIEPWLFQSSAVGDVPAGVDCVVNLVERGESGFLIPSGSFVRVMLSPIPDTTFRGIPWLDSTVDTILRWKQEGLKVLVHCQGGISRSSLVVGAVLMKENGWAWGRALGFLWERRPTVNPNHNFGMGLREYGEFLTGGSR